MKFARTTLLFSTIIALACSENENAMESGTINAHKPTNHLRGDPSSSFVRADHIITEQDEQEGEEHPNSRELAVVASFEKTYGSFWCPTNTTFERPYQSCMNTLASLCKPGSPLFSTWDNCHIGIVAVRDKLNQNWKNYVNSCAKWLTGKSDSPTSDICKGNTTVIVLNETAYLDDGITTVPITRSVTDAIASVWQT